MSQPTADGIKALKEFKINNFDLLRLIAATQVIVDHYFQHLNIPISKSALNVLYLFPGVPMFFVISGYLISASFERNNSLAIYFKNRALRIYPGLWGVIVVTIIVISATGTSFLNKQTVTWLPCQLAGFIYTPHFLANYGFGSYNGSLWTLPIELQFYIVLPLCYFLAPKKYINYWFYGLVIVFMAFNFSYEYIIGDNFTDLLPKLISYSFVPYFYMFLIGVILQRLRIYSSKFIYNKAFFWVAAYVIFSLTLNNLIEPIIFLIIKNMFLAFSIISLAYTLPQAADKLLRNNDISYGIYIYHGLILTVIVQQKFTSHINVYEVIALSYAIAYLSWICIEKPFIKRKERTIKNSILAVK